MVIWGRPPTAAALAVALPAVAAGRVPSFVRVWAAGPSCACTGEVEGGEEGHAEGAVGGGEARTRRCRLVRLPRSSCASHPTPATALGARRLLLCLFASCEPFTSLQYWHSVLACLPNGKPKVGQRSAGPWAERAIPDPPQQQRQPPATPWPSWRGSSRSACWGWRRAPCRWQGTPWRGRPARGRGGGRRSSVAASMGQAWRHGWREGSRQAAEQAIAAAADDSLQGQLQTHLGRACRLLLLLLLLGGGGLGGRSLGSHAGGGRRALRGARSGSALTAAAGAAASVGYACRRRREGLLSWNAQGRRYWVVSCG